MIQAVGDPDIADYVRERYTHLELMVHTADASPSAGVEAFTWTGYDPGISVADMVRWAHHLGLKVMLCLDWHYGNGMEYSHSPVGSGKYHWGIKEGGVRQALDTLCRWARSHANITMLKLGNEQKVPDAWYFDLVVYASKVIPDHWDLVVGGEESNMEAAIDSGVIDCVDIHLLRSDWRRRLSWARNNASRILVTEMSPPLDMYNLDEFRVMCRELLTDDRVEMVSLFGGGPVYHGRDKVRWNFKLLPQFLGLTRHGQTEVGRVFESVFPLDTSVPPQPPIEPLPPEDPCAGIRERCGRIADRLEEDYDGGNSQMLRRQVAREIPRLREIQNG